MRRVLLLRSSITGSNRVTAVVSLLQNPTWALVSPHMYCDICSMYVGCALNGVLFGLFLTCCVQLFALIIRVRVVHVYSHGLGFFILYFMRTESVHNTVTLYNVSLLIWSVICHCLLYGMISYLNRCSAKRLAFSTRVALCNAATLNSYHFTQSHWRSWPPLFSCQRVAIVMDFWCSIQGYCLNYWEL